MKSWLRWRVFGAYLVGLVSLPFARPTVYSLFAGALITGTGLAIRAAAAGHLRKGQALASAGPYARTRNPLYLGSMLLWGGYAVAGRSWVVVAMFAAYFLAFYPAAIRQEESALRAQYGEAFQAYAREVPLLRPRLRAAHTAPGPHFSFVQYAQNREYQATIVAVVFFLFLCAIAIWRA